MHLRLLKNVQISQLKEQNATSGLIVALIEQDRLQKGIEGHRRHAVGCDGPLCPSPASYGPAFACKLALVLLCIDLRKHESHKYGFPTKISN